MGQEAAVPAGFWPKVQKMVDDAVATFARSGFLRNAAISDGGLTIKGGFLRLLSKVTGGVEQFYLGPAGDVLGNGERQQVWVVRRADGTVVLDLRDAFPDADGTLDQALNWRDRAGNVVLADDTDSGQGIARPWLTGGFARARYADMSVSTTAASFETLWEAKIAKQQPRLEVAYRSTMDTSGTTGETRVLVNDVPIGSVAVEGFVVATRIVGPIAVDGAHMSELTIKIQGRRTGTAGALRVEPLYWRGQQT